jgi:nitroreductase
VEFRDVLGRRKMVRTFEDGPVDSQVIDRILWAGQRAPSAGYTQGFEFLVLQGPEEVQRFWDIVGGGDPEWPGEGTRRAPMIVVPLGSKAAYLERYAESDKGWTDRDESRWSAPYWTIDTAFAAMVILLAAVDEGLGGLFFGLYPPSMTAFRAAYGIPDEWEPIGAIAVGHPARIDPVRSSRDTRPRRGLEEIVHRGHW